MRSGRVVAGRRVVGGKSAVRLAVLGGDCGGWGGEAGKSCIGPPPALKPPQVQANQRCHITSVMLLQAALTVFALPTGPPVPTPEGPSLETERCKMIA